MKPLRIGLSSGTYPPYAAVYLARERGYFAAQGIAAELLPQFGGGKNQEAFERGEVDICHVNASNLVLARAKGVSQVGFGGVTPGPSGYHVLVRQGSPARTFKDLAGKRMGVSAMGSSTAIYPLCAAGKEGIDLKLELVGSDGLVPALLSGAVDAITVWPLLSFQLMDGGEARSVLDFGAELGESVPAVWAASGKMAKHSPELLHGFVAALRRSIRDLKSDRAFAVRYLMPYSGGVEERIVDLAFDDVVGALSEGSFVSRRALSAALEAAVLGGVIDAMPDLDDIFTWRFAPG